MIIYGLMRRAEEADSERAEKARIVNELREAHQQLFGLRFPSRASIEEIQSDIRFAHAVSAMPEPDRPGNQVDT